jgi:hypothetical protein
LERLNLKTDVNAESGRKGDQAFFMSRFHEKWLNCDKLGHKAAQCKLKREQEKQREIVITAKDLITPRITTFNYLETTDMIPRVQTVEGQRLQYLQRM